MKKKFLAIALAAIFGSAIISSCSSRKDTGNGSDTSKMDTSKVAPPPPPADTSKKDTMVMKKDTMKKDTVHH